MSKNNIAKNSTKASTRAKPRAKPAAKAVVTKTRAAIKPARAPKRAAAKAAGKPAVASSAEFMAHAYAMEAEAAERYAEFADSMETHNNLEVASMFRTA